LIEKSDKEKLNVMDFFKNQIEKNRSRENKRPNSNI